MLASRLRFIDEDRSYWLTFFAILAAAIVLRLFWAFAQVYPFTAPDTGSYIGPALGTPLLPFDQVRTAGFPYVIVAGLLIFGHPIGIIFVQNLLWLVSSVLLVVTLRKVLNFKWLGLAILFYLGFVQKNLAFEYLLLSEHAARCFYLIFTSLILLGFRVVSLRLTVLLVLAVLFNILVKPSALALIPLGLLYFFITWRFNRTQSFKVTLNAIVFVVLIAAPLLGYMKAFERRLGDFTLSYFGGYNFFAHVGHFTNLDSNLHADVKKELKEFFPLYVRKYAAQGRYKPNWLIHNSFDNEMRQDFGKRSPQEVVVRHAGQSARIANRIFMDLAIEGVMSHKAAYAVYALKSTWLLLTRGFTFEFGDYFSRPSLKRAWASEKEFAEWLRKDERKRPLADRARAGMERFPGTTWPENSLRGRIYDSVHRGIEWIASVIKAAAYGVSLAGAAILACFLAGTAWMMLKGRRLAIEGEKVVLTGTAFFLRVDDAVSAILVGVVIAAYALAMGMYLVSDPPRFLLNIQDLIVTFWVMMAAFGWAHMRRVRHA